MLKTPHLFVFNATDRAEQEWLVVVQARTFNLALRKIDAQKEDREPIFSNIRFNIGENVCVIW